MLPGPLSPGFRRQVSSLTALELLHSERHNLHHAHDPGLLGHPRGERGSPRAGKMEAGGENAAARWESAAKLRQVQTRNFQRTCCSGAPLPSARSSYLGVGICVCGVGGLVQVMVLRELEVWK